MIRGGWQRGVREEEGRRSRRAARHGVSNKARNLTAGGGEVPISTSGILLQWHTLQ